MEREWNEDSLSYFVEPYLKINPTQFEHFTEYYYLSRFFLNRLTLLIHVCRIVNVHIFVDVMANDELISSTNFNYAMQQIRSYEGIPNYRIDVILLILYG